MSTIDIEPLNTEVIIKPDPKKEKTEGGMIIVDGAKTDNLQWATVMRVSKKVLTMKEGDRVLFPEGTGVLQEINGTKYRFISETIIKGIERSARDKENL